MKNTDQGLASAVYNQAALIASDLDLPDLARVMCHQHSAAYLHASPLPAMSAIRGLEPVVNLARLQTCAGNADEGRQLLLSLYKAVERGTSGRFEGVNVPANLTETGEDRHEVCAWLWRVLLADGTRTLTTKGRWADALAHIEAHQGIGKRMLDGRQVAVVAALVAGDTTRAADLLADTMPGDPWEQAVTACLTVLCRSDAGQPTDGHLTDLVTAYFKRKTESAMTVFDTRLGLTVLDVGSAEALTAHRIVADLHRRTTDTEDGYAARENLAHPLFIKIATDRQVQDCRALVRACALDAGTLPDKLRRELTAALRASDRVIRGSLTQSRGRSRQGRERPASGGGRQ
ncbi:hypothetical protein [Streptomyces tendae]